MTQTQQRALVAAVAGAESRRVRRGGAWWLWAAVLGAAWLVPVLSQLARVDWLLPPLLLVGVASLLRGRFLVDRLVVAFGLLFGVTVAVGLLLSVWPWGLAPVPVSGFAFTGLVGVAAVLRRGPSLRLRLRVVDVVPLVVGGLAWLVLWWPRRTGLFSDRFAVAAEGGDRGAHFMLFDTIRAVGGYVFQHRAASALEVVPGHQVYPQGGHFVVALLQNFVSSGTSRPSALVSMAQFLRFDTATVVVLCAVMGWAVVRIAGPGLSLRVGLPAGVLAGGLLLFGDLETIIKSGFWAEQVCLVLLVVLFALLVRPLPSTGEQVVVLAALNVAVAYTYYFALPVAVVGCVLWGVCYRRRVYRHWLLTLCVGVGAVVVGVVPILVNLAWIQDNQGTAAALDAPGALDPVGGGVPVVLGGLLVAGVLVGRRWLTPVTVMVGGVLAACGLYLADVGYFQWLTLLHTDYYYEKTLHVVSVALVLMVGLAVRRLAPALARPTRITRTPGGLLRPLVMPVLTTVVLTVAMVEIFNPIPPLVPPAKPLTQPSRGRLYLTGRLVAPDAPAVLDIVAHVPDPDHRATIVMPTFGGDPGLSSWVAVLQRDYPRIQTWRWWADDGRPAPDRLVAFILANPQPYQIVTTDETQLAALRQLQHDHPDTDIQIVEYNPSLGYKTNW